MRLSRFLVVSVALFVLAPIVLLGCGEKRGNIVQPQDDGGIEATQQIQLVSYEFTPPISFDDLAAQAETNGLVIEEIRMEFDDFACGYTVAGKPLDGNMHADLIKQHTKFLELITERSTEDEFVDSQSLHKVLRSVYDGESITINVVTFRGSVSDLELTAEVEQREDVVVFPSDAPRTHRDEEGNDSTSPAPQSYWHERWAPYWGWSKVTTGFSFQEFRFNNVIDFRQGHRTYEHETHIWNRGFVEYDNYWASNMPYAYLDTRFLDGDIENYTIGCARAELLQVGRMYWTFMAFRPQGSPTSLCKIKGQIGHRIYPTCYLTWCIIADATTTPHLAYLALPNYGVEWTY